MKATTLNLQRIFEQTIRYRVPLFQRPYVWEQHRNWAPLWDAIRRLAERFQQQGQVAPYFLGAVVLDQITGATGSIESRQVIDGQQRLTTLQIFMATLRDLANYYELPKFASRFQKLTQNDVEFCETPTDIFKVWPTNCDRDVFQATMTAGSEEILVSRLGLPENIASGVRMADAYRYFRDVLMEWIEEDNPAEAGEDLSTTELEARYEALWKVIRHQLQLVVIDLEADDDPQIIFETLNNHGTQLLPADLIKNLLFREAEVAGANADELNTAFWVGFEADFWRQEIRQGRLCRPRIDWFLQHFLTLRTLEDVPVTQIFNCYRNYFHSSSASAGSGEDSERHVTTRLAELQRYSRIYQQFNTTNPESFKGRFFSRMAAIDTVMAYPLLLEAFHDLNTPNLRAELRQLIRDIESFLVRRMICGLTTKNYNKLFPDIIRSCRRQGRISAEAVRRFLLKLDGDSVRWPDNRELRDAMLNRRVYKELSRAKLRMLLLAFERRLEDGKTEPVIYTDPKSFTVEHIMPQAWQKHWPLPTDQYPDDEVGSLEAWRDRLIHTIGNLTLLTKKLNPSLAARGWEYKQKELLAKSKMNLNRSSFTNLATWSEESIEKRSRELHRLAIRIWPFPRSVEDATIE
ncbi:MAG: hypothetical protein RLZZ436_2159 [Planctomycetota bacterium]|jgi:hypothetical protein